MSVWRSCVFCDKLSSSYRTQRKFKYYFRGHYFYCKDVAWNTCMKFKKHDKIIVEWDDIASPRQYWADEEEGVPVRCISIGFFVVATREKLCISQTVVTDSNSKGDEDADFGGILAIPI